MSEIADKKYYNTKNNIKSNNMDIRSNIQSNLQYLIKKYNIDNDILAQCTGVSVSTIASLRSRATNPTILTLYPIAEFFNISIDQLINEDCSFKYPNNIVDLNKSKNINLVVLDLNKIDISNQSGNIGSINNLEYTNKNNDNLESVNTTADINPNCYAVKLDSEVLKPNYNKNTILIIDPELKPQDGNIVLVSLTKNTAKPTFRQVFVDSNTLYFRTINTEFGGMQAYNTYKIHGVVVRAVYNVV